MSKKQQKQSEAEWLELCEKIEEANKPRKKVIDTFVQDAETIDDISYFIKKDCADFENCSYRVSVEIIEEKLFHLMPAPPTDATPMLQSRQRRLLRLLRSVPCRWSQSILSFLAWRYSRKNCLLTLDPWCSDSRALQSMLRTIRRAKRRGRKVEVQYRDQWLTDFPYVSQVWPEDREECSLRRQAVSKILSEPGVVQNWL